MSLTFYNRIDEIPSEHARKALGDMKDSAERMREVLRRFDDHRYNFGHRQLKIFSEPGERTRYSSATTRFQMIIGYNRDSMPTLIKADLGKPRGTGDIAIFT